MSLERRSFLAAGVALAGSACLPVRGRSSDTHLAQLAALERDLGGRLGAAFLLPRQRETLAYRGAERFPMCSTFKTSLAALALALAQEGRLDLSQRIVWDEADLLPHTPFTRERLAEGATLRELVRTAQVTSDNLAANLVLARVGGPGAVTAFWRGLGDRASRLDRIETQLNFVAEGDVRDTSTPAAMAATLARLLAARPDGPLDAGNRTELRRWMVETRTGLARIRAGLPADWVAGDKTGNSGAPPGMGYARGDIGFAIGPSREPVFFAVYHQSPVDAPIDGGRVDAAFAEIGRVLVGWTRQRSAGAPA